ncbi:hypothetical protein ACODT5_14420 [Streptomyces sp. 5.8]|uniref:hypothetical protein n=1 Tax=Streptomyces sp. 5.8 TaxID=3406571 RepID=UPI003BB5A9E9
MTATAPAQDDANRTAILAAMDRLLAGTPLRSTGRLSVSQLALEAGVKRWYLTHQYLDLKDLFQARVKATGNTPAAFAKRLDEFDLLKKKHAELLKYTAELEERFEIYAASINLLSLENAALAEQLGTAARVTPIRPQRRTASR